MNIVRAIISGAIIWILIFVLFFVMHFVPSISNSENTQFLLMYLFLIPVAFAGLMNYYKKGIHTKGLYVGLVMAITALLLDALITLPFVIIPAGGTYTGFFTNPLLFVLVLELLLISFLYKKFKVK